MSTENNLPKLALSLPETAATLGIAAQTIRNQLSQNRFPIPARRVGDRVIFSMRDIEKFLSGEIKMKKVGRPRIGGAA